MASDPVPLRIPAASIGFSAEDRAWILEQIDAALESGQLTLGKHGRALEEAFAALCNTRFAIAVNSGTSALEIVLRAIGVEGREVVVPANTFYATAGAVVHAGGRPRFVDCEIGSFAIDPDHAREAIGTDTAAVIAVHIGGIVSARMGELRSICDAAGVPLIEDAAHAHGSALAGRPAGSFGRAAAFSFYPTKVMTSGEGGMIVTDDEAIHREALIFRDQGKEGFTTNFHVRLGYNWRMSEPHAIIGLAQLRRLDEFIEARNEIARVYDRELARLAPRVVPVRPPAGSRCNYYKYIALLDGIDRAVLKRSMRGEFGVALSGEVYDTPCHRQPVFQEFAPAALLVAEDLCARHVCLPVSAAMTEADARYVTESLAGVIERVASPSAV